MDASSISRRAATASVTTTPSPYSASEKIGRYRWKICALLFFATTMNMSTGKPSHCSNPCCKTL
jgi:hypothetical protein